ncbi:MAG TPA: 4Fe-4S dicluster domain-containing protein [Clostridiales bacterium]|nr:4Fe-4S dicluster domain-containing protein [Clostridiales bacterium]
MAFVRPNLATCTGCRFCEVVCSFNKSQSCDPFTSRIRIKKDEVNGVEEPVVCRQCGDPKCAQACPTGALAKDEVSGIVVYDKAQCILCGLCVEACPWGAIWLDSRDDIILKCDLCGGDPACVKYCPTKSLEIMELPESNQV